MELSERPTSTKAQRTRATLVDACRLVFERDGFINSRLTDITDEAQCSIGTFYTYFGSKEDALVAVFESVQDDMMHPGAPRGERVEGIRAVIAASNRDYLEAYRRNARLMLLLEQAATLEPRFAEFRLKRSRDFAARNARKILQLQQAGVADASLDLDMTSWALSSMISRLAYLGIVLGEPLDFEQLVETVTSLWMNALRIDEAQDA